MPTLLSDRDSVVDQTFINEDSSDFSFLIWEHILKLSLSDIPDLKDISEKVNTLEKFKV